MAEVDTSSYLKPAALPVQKSALDVAKDLGGLKIQQQQIQQNAIGIDQTKLNLVNEKYKIVSQKLMTLANKPDLTPDDIVKESQDALNEGLSSPELHAQFITEIPSKTALQRKTNLSGPQLDQAYTQTLRSWIDKKTIQAEQNVQALNHVYGVPDTQDNGQTTTPTRQGLRGPPVPVGAPIQKQIAPETPTFTPAGQRQLGPQTPQIPAGTLPVQGGLPGQYQQPQQPSALPVGPIDNPAIKGQSSNFGGKVIGATVEPNTAAGPMTGAPPMFEAGKTQLAQDQELATQKLTAVKPALQALPMIKDIMAGPGTDRYTKALATLKGFGILSTSANDPVAIRQEVAKKLAQYVSSNPVGQRSDAAQTLAEASSPNPNVQILPALIKLTKDAIILDRVQAARPGAFEGNDLSKYGQHRSTFPASIDERAFGLDLMEPKERMKLIKTMQEKKNTFEGKRFWRSLAIVDKQGLINTSGE